MLSSNIKILNALMSALDNSFLSGVDFSAVLGGLLEGVESSAVAFGIDNTSMIEARIIDLRMAAILAR